MTVRDVSPVLFFGDPDLLRDLGMNNSSGEEGAAKSISPITFLAPFQPAEVIPPVNEKVEDDGETDDSPKGVTHPATLNVSGTTPEQSASSVEIVQPNADSESQSDFNPSF